MMPTTMNNAALKTAWAKSSKLTATAASGRARAGDDEHEAELADRTEGEQQLQVVLAQRPQAAGDHRDQTRP